MTAGPSLAAIVAGSNAARSSSDAARKSDFFANFGLFIICRPFSRRRATTRISIVLTWWEGRFISRDLFGESEVGAVDGAVEQLHVEPLAESRPRRLGLPDVGVLVESRVVAEAAGAGGDG